MLTHRQRMEACLAQGRLDRPPVALWRHFPVDDQTPEGLAQATLAFQHTFDFDLVKVSPPSSYCLKDWGAQDEWRGDIEGTRSYTYRVIHQPEDWTRLTVLDARHGHLQRQLECLQQITRELGPDTPVLLTVFNPLSQAKNLAGPANLIVHLRQYPQQVHAGLSVITESTRLFIEAARQTGIAGIFYAVQHAQFGLLSTAEYTEFGTAYDLQVLEPAQELWLNMLHIHGVDVMFDLFADYPVQIVNWHDQETQPSLNEALDRFSGVVCGGLQRQNTMVLGTPLLVAAEARRALQATGGERFILGTGCVLPVNTPYGNIRAARDSLE